MTASDTPVMAPSIEEWTGGKPYVPGQKRGFCLYKYIKYPTWLFSFQYLSYSLEKCNNDQGESSLLFRSECRSLNTEHKEPAENPCLMRNTFYTKGHFFPRKSLCRGNRKSIAQFIKYLASALPIHLMLSITTFL